MGSSRRHGPTIGDLREIVSLKWCRPTNPFDEIIPGLYIGDATTALSLRTLKWEGITHVLNGALACASCNRKEICGGCVLTKDSYYEADRINFIGIQANDERRFPLWRYFEEAAVFIHEALQNRVPNIFCMAYSGFRHCFPVATRQKAYGSTQEALRWTAKEFQTLGRVGITHILNAALGKSYIRYVNTSQDYYNENRFPCRFMGIPAMDLTAYQLHPFFDKSTDFIHSAMSTPNGKVLVHCREGISRSATLVIAYLMMKKEMTAIEAVTLVRSKREIFPNDGFLEQLCDLDLRLRGERSFRGR